MGRVCERGKKAYDLKISGRLTWSLIAIMVNYADAGSAKRGAGRYAAKNDLRWPLEGFLTRGEIAYTLYCEGSSWKAIEETLFEPGVEYMSRSKRYARKYAKNHGRKWPIDREAKNATT